MVKEGSARKCSICEEYGHNSRTCNAIENSLKIFGVDILGKHKQPIKKSPSLPTLGSSVDKNSQVFCGYLSEGYVGSTGDNESHETRKGNPWTEEEQRQFLAGLKKLGKGDWKGIAMKFVTTRTPTQVASHAQKYFLRMSSYQKRKRRNSVFDLSLQDSVLESQKSSELPHKSYSQATSSSALPLDNVKEFPKNEGTQTEITNQFRKPWQNNHLAYPPPIAAYGIGPSYSEMQYMAAFSGNGRAIVPKLDPKMMYNYQYQYPTLGYAFMPYSYSTTAPTLAHPCSIPKLPLAPPSTSKKNSTELDLKIGLPCESCPKQGAWFPSHINVV
ncbi:Duplicated homeodomain-like superfamily protein [Euphorbia peplus]|nr:Duplicated homeodomain-like superfamily protein [Euphorbia peplus]